MLKKIYLLLFTLLFFIFSYIIYHRYSVYNYVPSKSYLYEFNKTDAKIVPITLKNNSFNLKNFNISTKNKTIFLELNISSTLAGKILNPSIYAISKDKSVKNDFELFANGKRYINISSLSDAKKIEIKTKRCILKNKKAKLIIFKNPTLKNKTILILAPHPDDAEIAAFGLYSTYPKKTYIVTITAGDAGENYFKNIYKDDIKSSYLKKANLRVINSSTTPLLAGINISQSINLCYFDSTLSKMQKYPNKNIGSVFTEQNSTSLYRSFSPSPLVKDLKSKKNSWKSLVDDLAYFIRKFSPDIIIAPHPKLDAHPDHIMTTKALEDALNKIENNKKFQIFLYTNHNYSCEIYPFGDMFDAVTLPANFKKLHFNSIYSFNLNSKKQKDKFFALESMNDLRPTTLFQNPSDAIMIVLRKLKHIILGDDESYFRRAVRENELFFIYTRASLKHTFE